MRAAYFIIFLLLINPVLPVFSSTETPVDSVALGLSEFIHRVKDHNETLKARRLDWETGRERVKKAASIFEPEWVLSFKHEDVEKKSTKKEQQYLWRNEIDEGTDTYSTGINGLLYPGTKYRLEYSMDDISDTYNRDDGDEYQNFLGVSLLQPLLKGAGIKTTTAQIRIAETEASIDFQTYRRQLTQLIYEAATVYWNLKLAQDKYKVRLESVANAEKLLKDNQEKTAAGKVAQTEVIEAMAGLIYRQSLETAARQSLVESMNQIRTFLAGVVNSDPHSFRAVDDIDVAPLEISFEESVKKAFRLRFDYLAAQKRIEREQIRIAFAKNQRWPQLDLSASYGLNGLGNQANDSLEKAWDRDYISWDVGLSLTVPLGGGRQSRSELAMARYQKQQALLEFKSVEKSVINAIDSARHLVESERIQVSNYDHVVALNRELLDIEMARFSSGKSNSRLLLEKEEELNRALEAEKESRVRYKKAVMQLDMAQGSLLETFGVDIGAVEGTEGV